jgi:hypothetical protein
VRDQKILEALRHLTPTPAATMPKMALVFDACCTISRMMHAPSQFIDGGGVPAAFKELYDYARGSWACSCPSPRTCRCWRPRSIASRGWHRILGSPPTPPRVRPR